MIRIEGTRFGTVEIAEDKTIRFPNGLVGFANETEFALLERAQGGAIAYLQSLTTPELAFPVTDGLIFGPEYPTPAPNELAESAGVPEGDLITLVIIAVNPETRQMVANQLAPLVIDANTREGAQVVLDPRQYSASFVITQLPENLPAATNNTGETTRPPGEELEEENMEMQRIAV